MRNTKSKASRNTSNIRENGSEVNISTLYICFQRKCSTATLCPEHMGRYKIAGIL